MPSFTVTNYEAQIDRWSKVPTDIVSEADRTQMLYRAVEHYSKYRPRKALKDITGTGAFTVALPTDPAWEDGFSFMLEKIENYDSSNQSPDYVEDNEWIFLQTATDTFQIRFLRWTPSVSETIRLRYAIRHGPSASSTVVTVPDADFLTVCHLTVAFVLQEASAFFAKKAESSMGADVVAFGEKSSNYSRLADWHEEQFNKSMGLDKDTPVAAAASIGEWDTTLSENYDWLTHGSSKER